MATPKMVLLSDSSRRISNCSGLGSVMPGARFSGWNLRRSCP
jgi:hypothetical protein